MNLPSISWPQVPLKEITTKIGSGATPLGGKESYKDSGITLIRSLNVYDFHFDCDGLAHIDEEQANQLANVEIQSYDILLNITGASVARCCMVPTELLPARVNQHVSIVRIDPTVANPRFILYCLNCPRYKQLLLNIAQGGATREALTQEKISNFQVPFPPLPIQHKIVSILSAYDDLIENNTRRIKILEDMAQLIYRDWFVNFRFPGNEKVKKVESEFGMIPEGWDVRYLSDFIDTQYGFTESAKSEPVGPKFLRGMDINKSSYIDWSTVPYCPIADGDYRKYRLKEHDIVIIRMADPGKVGMVEKEVDAVFASYLIRLQIKSQAVSPYYVFYFLLSERYQGYITGASTGTTRKSAAAGVITNIKIVVPPRHAMNEFESNISDMRRLLVKLVDANTNLRATRDLLLPKLISGELDVEKLDIDTGGLNHE